MKLIETKLPEVVVIEPKVFTDDRGHFFERYNRRAFSEAIKADYEFVQDNHSRSKRTVLRGLHYQIRQPQGKLVSVTIGEIFDVAVDLRRSSPSFGQSVGFGLSAEGRRMAWIPPGFAHGFLVLSEFAEVLYKATDYYAPEHERTLLWNDPALRIEWPLTTGVDPILAPKDRNGQALATAEVFA
jgi:dTDP-4-dehydrorhamnose 3,5-epimerase